MSNEIERIYSELTSIKEVITKNGSPSDIVAFEAIAAKSLLLAAASYFEKTVLELILKHAEKVTNSTAVVSFLDRQALKRKYHFLFDWESTNINKFIRLFGDRFGDFMAPRLAEETIKTAVKDFVFIGQTRNELSHNNFSEYSMQMTAEDIKSKFDSALPLVTFLAKSLNEFELVEWAEQDSRDQGD
jgi:hypothetical protein